MTLKQNVLTVGQQC